MPLAKCPMCYHTSYGSTCNNCDFAFVVDEGERPDYPARSGGFLNDKKARELCQLCDKMGSISNSTRGGNWYCREHYHSVIRQSEDPLPPLEEYTVDRYRQILKQKEQDEIDDLVTIIVEHDNKNKLNQVMIKLSNAGKDLSKDFNKDELNKVIAYLNDVSKSSV